ncbi:Sulfur acceptor protein =_ iron-sulfur cluster assembly SufE [hydrothermal vent metagenome]|uniref:Sulfur acceptor protein => iron-sulfur cluster assembly SufE n=1 Tax=hydrothermal vent metagenome TaxID=652676 RepID=A0A3B1E0H9_9ZZZZ
MTIEELLEEFSYLEDWGERCDFLIDLGFGLPPFAEDAKTEENRVHGCQSMVWMVTEMKEGNVVGIQAESDAMIVKGLIFVLLTLFANKSPQEIMEVDVKSVFTQIGLDKHLSVTRKNGLNGMVKRIHDFALSYIRQSNTTPSNTTQN